MNDAKLWDVLGPEREEVIGHANLSSSVHLRRLAIKFRYLDLGSSGRIGSRNVELNVKLVLDVLIDVPASSKPASAFLVRLNLEPV